MKILFDHQHFSTQKHGGITRYFANLNQGLNEFPGIEATIGLLYSENEYFKNPPLNNSIGKVFLKGHNGRTYRWNKRYTNRLIKANDFDVLHPTYYNPDFLKNLKRPFVLTVHDMIHELFPALFSDADTIIAGKESLIEKADAVIAISEHTKNDIIKFFPDASKKISVVHHGYNHLDLEKANLSLPDKYILYVGDRVHYKNFNLFIKAVAPILQTDTDLNIVCVGGGRFNETEMALLTQLKITLKCRQLTVTDAELQQLYQQAELFIFPSLQEGFGLPLLEAFANNCPVCCSKATSFPEVAGDAAQYFDPLDENSIAESLNEVLQNPELRLRLIKKGQQRVQLFTMQNCVNKTLNVYKSLTDAAGIKA